jgi:hypothetical protein
VFSLHDEVVLELVKGRFGQLSVCDGGGIRSLSCTWACHGSVWIEPAVEIGGVRFLPGPLPESLYLLTWLLAAAARPDGHVLMAGLGAGVGPIALAWAFPALRITVVEIDPEMITLARRHFPLLAHYEAQGQIRIVRQDIVEHVWQATDNDWSIACLDAYQETTSLYSPSALLQALHGRADAIWMNILESNGFEVTRRYADTLIDAGWQPQCVMPVQDHTEGIMCGNVLLGTQPIDVQALSTFAPFSSIDHPFAQRANAQLANLLTHVRPWSTVAVPVEELDALATPSMSSST